jgi:NTP pyrophosphatase (non-canonical NTP hydrolase)
MSEKEKVLNRYATFVDGVTSQASKNKEVYLARIEELYAAGVDVARLNTAAIGLSSESGELLEIVKKDNFHGKPLNEENLTHARRELGDIIWYWTNACMALDIDPYEVIETNVAKLQARYPGGVFDVYRAENRQEGDN